MIGKLSGIIDTIDDDHIILDVNGVGYVVNCSGNTLRQIGAKGSAASLYTETIVREDAIILQGFADVAERDCFRLLTTVQGVGTRIAMAILSIMNPEQIMQALAAHDQKAFSEADGVGPKLAARIVNELKDKAAKLVFGGAKPSAVVSGASRGELTDAVSALVNLGYKRMDAFAAATGAMNRLDGKATAEQLIREGLKELAKLGE